MKFSRLILDTTGWTLLAAFTGTTILTFSGPAYGAPPALLLLPASAAGPWSPPAPVYSREYKSVTPPQVAPPVFNARLAELPDVQELQRFRALARPLVVAPGKAVSDQHRRATARAMEQYAEKAYGSRSARLQVLVDHLRSQPDSPFATSIWLEVSISAQQSGDFTLAVEAGREAWQRASTVEEKGEALNEAETALAHLARLYGALGQRSALSDLLTEVMGRPAHTASRARLAEMRQLLASWDADPNASAKCGIIAYNTLAVRSGAPLLHKPTQEWDQKGTGEAERRKQQSELNDKGLSAARLVMRVKESGSDWHWIKRTSGSLVPAPSVAHFIFGGETGHYSALLEGDGQTTHAVDPFLRLDTQVENTTLLRQASGYFMVAANMPTPEGYIEATAEELESVFGRACPFGSDCEGEPPPCSCGNGMAVASIAKFLPGLIVQDQPLTYQPLYGPTVSFMMQYRNVPLHGEDVSGETSSFGPLWGHGYTSYVKAEDGSALPGSTTVRVYFDGTFYEYTRSGASYVPRYTERPALSQLAVGYKLTFPDGSYQEFTQPNGVSPTRYYLKKVVDAQGYALNFAYDAYLRISTITDATTKVTTFGYTGTDLKIASITDPFSRTATFTYDGSGRLDSITDAIGIESSFVYDDIDGGDGIHPDRIVSLTTPYGTTQVAYENEAVIFDVNDLYWAVTLTDPEGFSSREEHRYHSGYTTFDVGPNAEPRAPASVTVGASSVPFLTTDPDIDHFDVTMSWNKKQWYHYQADRAAGLSVNAQDYAEYTLWLMKPGTGFSVNVPLATRRPGQSATWYNYPGQTGFYGVSAIGTSSLPDKTVRQVENESGVVTWVMTQQTYNTLGLPLIATDEKGRQTKIVYAANNQDPATFQALTTPPSTWSILRTYGTFTNHLPSTVTEASGLITTYTYNAQSQVTKVQFSKSTSVEAVRYTYSASGTAAPAAWPGAPGFLRKIERIDPANATLWVTTDQCTYDSASRIRTHTDASGYVRTFDYDNFDRPTLATHPDATTQQFSYLMADGTTMSLDMTASKDRAGRWWRTLYSPRRQPVVQIAPDGDITQLQWCLCGQMQQLIDPLGRVTKWKWNIAGQNLEKIMPDGTTKTTYTYEARSGRLSTLKRPNDQGGGTPTATYRYFVDGRLQKEDYTDAGTPDVTYAYEANSPGRVTSVVDGIGTHAFAYVPFTAGTAGAGRVATLNSPLANDTISNAYDWQDRVTTENLLTDAVPTPANIRAETYTWDSLARPKTVVNTLGTYTYGYTTNLTRPDSLTQPNTVVSNYTYNSNTAAGDSAQRLATVTHLRNSIQQAKHLYTYDSAGRTTAWEQQSITQPNMKSSYGYNLGDELVQAEDKNLSTGLVVDRENWGLDNGGNWLSRTRTATSLMETRTIDSMNRLTQVGGSGTTVVEGTVNEFSTVTVSGDPAEMKADPVAGNYRFKKMVPVTTGSNTVAISATDTDTPPQITNQNWQFTVPGASRSFTYDANGNTLTDGIRTMTWDAKNRLKTVTIGANTWKWDYDYRDRRVKEYLNNVATKLYVWSGDHIIQERTASTNAITRTHYFGGFSDGAAPTTGTKYQTLADHLGNIREVLTTTGTMAARYDYTPYQGPVLVGTATVTPTFLTIGRYFHHTGSGLELALYRAYDPTLGRWMSEDPIGERGGANLFGFLGNQPITRSDKLGLFPLLPGEGRPFLPAEGSTYHAVEATLEYDGRCPNVSATVYRQGLGDIDPATGDLVDAPGMRREAEQAVFKKALDNFKRGCRPKRIRYKTIKNGFNFLLDPLPPGYEMA